MNTISINLPLINLLTPFPGFGPKRKRVNRQETVLAEPTVHPTPTLQPEEGSVFVELSTSTGRLDPVSKLSITLFRQLDQPNLRFTHVNKGRTLHSNTTSSFCLPLPATFTEADLATFSGILISVQNPTGVHTQGWYVETLKVTTNLKADTALDPEIFVTQGAPVFQFGGRQCTKYWSFASAMKAWRMAA